MRSLVLRRSFDLSQFMKNIELSEGAEVVGLKFDGNNVEIIVSR